MSPNKSIKSYEHHYTECKSLKNPPEIDLNIEYDLISDHSIGDNLMSEKRISYGEYKFHYLDQSINNLNKNKDYFELYKMLIYHYNIVQHNCYLYKDINVKLIYVNTDSSLNTNDFNSIDNIYRDHFEGSNKGMSIETFRCRVNYFFRDIDRLKKHVYLYMFAVNTNYDDVNYETLFGIEKRDKVSYGV